MRYLLSAAILLSASVRAYADFPVEGTIAPSAIVGTIGSISGKYFVTDVDAVDAAAEFMDHPWQVFYADYYRHFHRLFGKGTRFGRETSLYGGLGAGAGFWDRNDNCGRWNCSWNKNTTGTGNGFFIRAVAGVEWYPRRTLFSVFAEVAPSYLWYPTNGSTLDFGAGGRFNF